MGQKLELDRSYELKEAVDRLNIIKEQNWWDDDFALQIDEVVSRIEAVPQGFLVSFRYDSETAKLHPNFSF